MSNPFTSIDPGSLKIGFLGLIQNAGSVRMMVQINQKNGIGVENPSPRSCSGGISRLLVLMCRMQTHVCRSLYLSYLSYLQISLSTSYTSLQIYLSYLPISLSTSYTSLYISLSIISIVSADLSIYFIYIRPTQSIMYVPLQVNTCQKCILLIVEYKYLKSCSGDLYSPESDPPHKIMRY